MKNSHLVSRIASRQLLIEQPPDVLLLIISSLTLVKSLDSLNISKSLS
jgi:hypothetical protein